ncbi:MAG: hypothetical protein M1815_001085 [Lichina confinis]|nr:MAG: hypothetical protein M1815_001085 [Lichina confinis]
MSRLKRPADWYQTWMPHDGPSVDDGKRRQVAVALHDAIRSNTFDPQTLHELSQILDHECFCRRPKTVAVGETSAPPATESQALTVEWTTQLVQDLSGPLIRSVYSSSNYQRELQYRALLSSLILQGVQGVTSFQDDQYHVLQDSLRKRSGELQLQPRQADDAPSRERFHRLQCSYLLVAAAEYAKRFRQNRTWMLSLMSRTTSIVFALGGIGVALSTGVGAIDLHAIVKVVDESLKPLWEAPDERYKNVFVVLLLTRVALALQLYADVHLDREPAETSVARRSAQDVAARALDEILSLLPASDALARISPPGDLWGDFLAFLNRGPRDFDEYFYVYGLLDCATQLARIVQQSRIPAELQSRMRRVVVENRANLGFRWKAIEFLLSCPEKMKDGLKDVRSIRPAGRDIQSEIDVLSRYLSEEDGTSPIPSRESLGIVSQPLREISVQGWLDDSFEALQITKEAGALKIGLKQDRLFRGTACYSAGLSPDCSSAYFLAKRLVAVYSFGQSQPPALDARCTFRDRRPEDASGNQEAAMSNGFLAVLSKTDLTMYQLLHSSPEATRGKVCSLEPSSTDDMLDPKCLAVHEADRRVWVAVGGRTSQDGSICGVIRMYRADVTDKALHLSPYRTGFDQATPKVLHNDFVRTLGFSPDGSRLVCVTNSSRVLCWRLSNNARPRLAPFMIEKHFTTGTCARGMTSAAMFSTPSQKPYILCTTSPSTERSRNDGEWSFISAVADSPALVPKKLTHSLYALQRDQEMTAGAASPRGDAIALLDKDGFLTLFPLAAEQDRGLHSEGKPIVLKERLSTQIGSSATCLRFHVLPATDELWLYALDCEALALWK